MATLSHTIGFPKFKSYFFSAIGFITNIVSDHKIGKSDCLSLKLDIFQLAILQNAD